MSDHFDIESIESANRKRFKNMRAAEQDFNDLILFAKELKAKISQKDRHIQNLEAKVRQLTRGSSGGSHSAYNELNVKYNELIKRVSSLEEENRALKSKKRAPLGPPHVNINSKNNVMAMLSAGTPSKIPRPKQEPLETQMPPPPTQSNKTAPQISMPPALEHSPTSDLALTQYSLTDENEAPEEDDAVYETMYDPQDLVARTRKESMDLGGSLNEAVASFPYEDSHIKSSQPISIASHSSPEKIKRESQTQMPTEIEDSQYDSECELDVPLPTPKTTSKLQTPIARAQTHLRKRLLALQTPAENTPLKKPKVKPEPIAPSTAVMDISSHPKRKTPWVPEDFRVNPAKNNGYDHAYHTVLRGAQRRCLHGRSCSDCHNFYKMMGELPTSNGPRWSTEVPDFEVVVRDVSKHRDLWEEKEAHEGFGEFEFPSTQRRKEIREINERRKCKVAYERLYSALNDGRYEIRDNEIREAVKNGKYTIDKGVWLKYLETEFN